MKRRYIAALFVFLLLLHSMVVEAAKEDDLNLSVLMQPADSSHFMRDSEYFNWCNSVIKDTDGKYHLFYARWPKSLSFYSWLTHSEIAHAVADQPDGPYRNAETVLRARHDNWDAVSVHNVQVNKFGKKYYMYYTSTNSGDVNLNDSMLAEVGSTGYSHRYWNLLRSNQRAGVAVSKDLYGPWKRKDAPMVVPQPPIYTVAVNPSVCKGGDGAYYLIIKGDNNPSPKRHLIQAVGRSSKPTGPFIFEKEPAFADIPTEDVCMWYDRRRERFYALFHAHGGDFIGMITSEDGLKWHKATHYVVCKKEVPLKDGTVMKVERMERPYVYVENGEVKMVSFAVKRGKDSFIVFFKSKI